MLRIFADALLLVTRQPPLPRHDHHRVGNPEVEEARLRRAAAPSSRAC